MESNLYFKYLKYKNKYIQLKNEQIGGGLAWNSFLTGLVSLSEKEEEKENKKFIDKMNKDKSFQQLELIMRKYMEDKSIESIPIPGVITQDALKLIITEYENDPSNLYKTGQEALKKNKKMTEEMYSAYYTPKMKGILKWSYESYLQIKAGKI